MPAAKNMPASPRVPAPRRRVSSQRLKNLPPQPPQMPIQSNRREGGSPMAGIVVVIIIIIIIIAAFFILNNRSKDQTNSSSNNSSDQVANNSAVDTNAQEPQQEADPFLNWNYYKDASSTYEFKYPANWQIKTSGSNIQLIYPDATDTQSVISLQTTKKTLSDYLAALDKTALTAYEGKPSVNVKDEQKKKINGFEAVERLQTLNAAGLEQKITYIYNNGKILSFSMARTSMSSDWVQAYDLILSSFKFIVPASTSPATSTTSTATTGATSSVATYNNALYGFQVQYDSILSSKTVKSGISFNIDKEQFLNINGFASGMPSLVGYHPNGASMSGQITISGKDAVKFVGTSTSGTYVQYIVALSGGKWLKIEYQGSSDNAVSFEKIISTIKI